MAVMKVSHAVAIVKIKEMSLQNGLGLPLGSTANKGIFLLLLKHGQQQQHLRI
jgi:hypothetical protein